MPPKKQQDNNKKKNVETKKKEKKPAEILQDAMDEAHSAYLKDHFDKCKTIYEEILAKMNAKQVADILRVQTKLAQVYIKVQRYGEANNLLEQILSKNPKDVKLLYQKAFCLYACGNYQDCLQVSQDALQYKANDHGLSNLVKRCQSKLNSTLNTTKNPFDLISTDMAVNVLSFMPHTMVLKHVALVCWDWYLISERNELWKLYARNQIKSESTNSLQHYKVLARTAAKQVDFEVVVPPGTTQRRLLVINRVTIDLKDAIYNLVPELKQFLPFAQVKYFAGMQSFTRIPIQKLITEPLQHSFRAIHFLLEDVSKEQEKHIAICRQCYCHFFVEENEKNCTNPQQKTQHGSKHQAHHYS